MYSKLSVLFNEMLDQDFHTARDLAGRLNVSEKTVRTRLKALNDILTSRGASIHSKSSMGYQLVVYNQEDFQSLTTSLEKGSNAQRPTNSNERVIFILANLLSRENYIKLDDLCETCYVSRNTMTADLKKVEDILHLHQLILDRRPNYGIAVQGNEFDKRTCIANNLIRFNHFMNVEGEKEQGLKIIGKIVLSVLHRCGLSISEVSLENLVSHVFIAVYRTKHGHAVSIDHQRIGMLVKPEVIEATGLIVQQVEEALSLPLNQNEFSYIDLHMGAKLSSTPGKKSGVNIVISRKIDELTGRMLEILLKSFNIDFMDNLELRMSLNQHLVPLDIRMQFDIPLSNPLLHEIKKEYAFAYTLAATACIALSEHYATRIPDDEIAYFAIIFELARMKKDKKIEKKNIIIVCASGKGTTQLFMYKYRQAFGNYVEHIYECTAWELGSFDFAGKNIDYIFTTVPVNTEVPVPVFEVTQFLESKDIATCSEVFESNNHVFLYKYYRPELFLTNISASTKEEVLRILCQHTEKTFPLPAGFYDAVMKREALGQTDFGNLVAIPHPFQVMTPNSFVAIGILERPVWWGHNDVQVVFLVSISADEDSDVGHFYQLTTKLLFDSAAIQQLLNNPTFDVIMDQLKGSDAL